MSISDLDKVFALGEKLIQQKELLKKLHNGEISQEEFDDRNKNARPWSPQIVNLNKNAGLQMIFLINVSILLNYFKNNAML